jgi:hypothetical protein
MPDKYVYEGSTGGYPYSLDEPKDENPEMCELCETEPATEKVDIDPLQNPGRYIVDCCPQCAAFERIKINSEKCNLY